MSLERIGRDKKIILIFLAAIFLLCVRNGPIFHSDSYTYIDHSLFRMGLYPLSISLFQLLFKGYALDALVGCQLVLSLCASYCLATFLQSTFKLPSMLRWVLLSVFLVPIIVLKSGNDILSEGLAYPLFLLTAYFFLKGVLQNSIKNLYAFSFIAFLLVYTRPQYLFFYPVAFISLLYFAFFQKRFKEKSHLFFSIVLSLSTFFMAERAYHYVYHNTFSGSPTTGTQLIVRPLFLAAQDSYMVLRDPRQKQFVKEALEELVDQNMINKDPHKRELDSFSLQYADIFVRILSPLQSKIWSKESLDKEVGKDHSDYEIHQIIDRETIAISLAMIKNNFSNFATAYIKDVIRGYGGYAFFGFVLFTSILCFWNIVTRRNNNPLCVSIVFSALIHFGNLTLVCLVEPPIMRYTYSTSLLLLSMLLIMAYQLTTHSTLATTDPSCAE